MKKAAKRGPPVDRGPVQRVCRRHIDFMRELGACVEAWRPGHVVLAPLEVKPAPYVLEALSELAMALAYASVCEPRRLASGIEMRVAVIKVRSDWDGKLNAAANALSFPSGRGWLLDCEVRGDHGDLLASAFAYVDSAHENRRSS